MTFDVTIVELPAKDLIGMKVRTDMQKASVDCPVIWHTFGPKIQEISSRQGRGESYGISWMINEGDHCNDFEYGAAVEVLPGTTAPTGMESITLPAGKYAKCTVPALDKLGDAYTYLYGEWIASQSAFALIVQAPCFELYPPDWQGNTPFDVFVPVNVIE